MIFEERQTVRWPKVKWPKYSYKLTLILYCFCCHSFLWYVVFLSGSETVQVFFYRLFIYVLPLEIQLSRGESWDPINRFNTATIVCPSQSRTWISNVICRVVVMFVFSELCWEVIVPFINIGEIVDNYCLTFFSYISMCIGASRI